VRRLLRAAAIALAALLHLSPAAFAREPREEGAALMNELMSGKVAVGAPFALPDARGRKRSLGEFRGKVVLLYFGYTTCPDVCPTDLANIGKAMRLLGAAADGVQPLFVTIDPRRDTPALLRDYVAAFDPRFIALRGSESEVRGIARSYKVFFRKIARPGGDYLIDHAAFTFLLDRSGKYVAFFPPGTPADRMATMVREVLDAR
jgi:cytochrome oxidase Cu insertion factor (SCO1/SenC/PrrC family)